jgi:hypothetical protein
MPSTIEINDFLDRLSENHSESSFVMVPPSPGRDFLWLEEFAFISSDLTEEPVEQPQSTDYLYLVVRNLGLTECMASFECKAEKGKIVIGGMIGAPFRVSLRAPANPGFEPLPNEEEISLKIESISTRTEFLHVANSFQHNLEGEKLRERAKALAFHFDRNNHDRKAR